jgi:hypothetical protein
MDEASSTYTIRELYLGLFKFVVIQQVRPHLDG